MSQHTTLNFITVSAAHMCMDVGTPPGAQATCQRSPPEENDLPSLSYCSLPMTPAGRTWRSSTTSTLKCLSLKSCTAGHSAGNKTGTPVLTTLLPRSREHHRKGGGKIVKAKGWERVLWSGTSQTWPAIATVLTTAVVTSDTNTGNFSF